MTLQSDSKRDGALSFASVARVASVLCCGVMAGFLYSVKQVNPILVTEWSFGTFLMTLLGGWLAWILWNMTAKLVADGNAADRRRRVRNLTLLVVGLFAVMLVSYGVAIKDIRRGLLLEILQGTSLALFVLSGIGFILYKLVRWLESEKPDNESEDTADSGLESPDDRDVSR